MVASARSKQIWLATIGVPLLLLSLYPLQRSIAEKKESIAAQQQELLLRSGKLLKKLSLGYDSLLADIYWTRTVQYNGGILERGESDFSLLAPLLDVTTDLDPRLDVAYQYGAIFLSEKVPAGAGRPDQAIALVRKGIAVESDELAALLQSRLRLLLVPARLPAGLANFLGRQQSSRRAAVDGSDGGAHRRNGRLARYFAVHVVADLRIDQRRHRPRKCTGASAGLARAGRHRFAEDFHRNIQETDGPRSHFHPRSR